MSSLPGIHWARHRQRLGEAAAARRLTEANRTICESEGWNSDLALSCDYYWGHHEALRQLRDTHRALGHAAETRQWDDAEQALAQTIAPEIAAALEINRQHDAKMKRLYGRK